MSKWPFWGFDHYKIYISFLSQSRSLFTNHQNDNWYSLQEMWCSPYHTFFIYIYILIEIKLFQTSVMPPFIKEDEDIPYPKGEPKWPQISPKALYHYFVIRILQQQCLEWFSNKNPRIFPQKIVASFWPSFSGCWTVLGSRKIHTYLMKIFLSKKKNPTFSLAPFFL